MKAEASAPQWPLPKVQICDDRMYGHGWTTAAAAAAAASCRIPWHGQFEPLSL